MQILTNLSFVNSSLPLRFKSGDRTVGPDEKQHPHEESLIRCGKGQNQYFWARHRLLAVLSTGFAVCHHQIVKHDEASRKYPKIINVEYTGTGWGTPCSGKYGFYYSRMSLFSGLKSDLTTHVVLSNASIVIHTEGF